MSITELMVNVGQNLFVPSTSPSPTSAFNAALYKLSDRIRLLTELKTEPVYGRVILIPLVIFTTLRETTIINYFTVIES